MLNTTDPTPKKKPMQARILLSSALCILVVFLGLFQFWTLLKDSLYESSDVFLTELNTQRVYKVRAVIGSYFSFLDSVASTLSRQEVLYSASAIARVKDAAQIPYLIDFSIITPDGTSHNSDGTTHLATGSEIFRAAIRGEKKLHNITRPGRPHNEYALAFYIPIYRGDTVIGVLCFRFMPEVVRELMQSKVFGGAGGVYILDSKGTILFQQSRERHSELQNFFTSSLENIPLDQKKSATEALETLKNSEDGSLTLYRGDGRLNIDYRKLGFNDWYLLSAIPGKAIDAQPYYIARITFLLCALIATALFLLMGYILHTTRKSAQEAERTREELSLLISNIPGGVLCSLNDIYSSHVSFSKGFLDLTGYTEEELGTLLDNKYLNMIHEDDRKQVYTSVDEQLKHGNTVELIYRLRCKSGKLLWILEKSQLVTPKDGAQLFYCVLLDISAQFEARQQVEESKQELENLTSNIPGGVIRCRYEDFNLEYASDGFLELLGYSREELFSMKGERIARTVHPQDHERLFKEVHEQFSQGNMLQVEYRLIKKSGDIVWVFYKARLSRKKNGEEVIDGVFIDITERKAILDNLHISEERYRLLSELTDSIIYEYDIRHDTLYMSSKWEEKFGYTLRKENVALNLHDTDIVLEADKSELFHLMESLMSGEKSGSCEHRIKLNTGEYIWYQNAATVVTDKDGTPVKILGKMFDVDTAKKKQAELTEKAQRDPLTGLYNKTTTRTLIETYLGGEGKDEISALMIVDVDNFKSVNDTLGHMFGDAVLSSISSDIQRLFRNTDVVGRIGGDEFIIFLKKMPLESFVVKSANAVCEALQNTFTGEHREYRISGSIGIAMYPRDGATYSELFKNADSALYQSKEKGKNQFTFFNMDTDLCLMCDLQPTTLPQHTVLLRPKSEYSAGLPTRILEALCETRDLYTAITFALQFVGKQYGVSRVYIFERVDDIHFNNTYEWCADGVTPQKETLQAVPLEQKYDYCSLFNEEGIFYCPDTARLNRTLQEFLVPHNVHATLQCSFREENVFKGFIGFDECGEARLWTKTEIDSLTLIAKILGLFIVKMRTHENLKKTFAMFQSALNNKRLWFYVVDALRYKLLFLNQKTQETTGAEEGMTCYKALRGMDAPCSDCPMHAIAEGEPAKTTEIYNSAHNIWIEATASPVPWEGTERAVLLCCFDITMYREQALLLRDKADSAPDLK